MTGSSPSPSPRTPDPAADPAWTPSVGAWLEAGTWQLRLWAPQAQRVELVLDDGRERELAPLGDGRFGGSFDDLRPGTRYRYRVDGRGPFPDPASRSQPDGVHGASALVDAGAFAWRDAAWHGVALEAVVLYELHVGTFTPDGTFAAAAARLLALAELGVTAVELMPVASFAGARNWGYDGVSLFAPAAVYGGPDGLRAFVDAAHAHGIAVVLDVVYNHFGPDGAYHQAIEPAYAAPADGPWGQVPNLRAAHHDGVRRFFVDNALHWLHEYHIDGLRIDATHAFVDDGAPPFLDQLVAELRAASRRPVLLFAEDDRNARRLIDPVAAGGAGLDAVWADDIHHQLRVAVAGDRDGYYAAYTGTADAIADAITHGWSYRGGHSAFHGRARGTPTDGLPRARFVACLQNHDQVGNRAFGDRLHHGLAPEVWRALSLLLLCLPETPLLFMGQEWAAPSPFLYFTDHAGALGDAVERGRREEFARFASFSAAVPSPQRLDTFESSRLDWRDIDREPHRSVRRLYRDALAFRRQHLVHPLDAVPAGDGVARALDADTVAIDRVAGSTSTRHVCVCRLRGEGRVRLPLSGLPPGAVTASLSTEDPTYTAEPRPILIAQDADGVHVAFARPGAVVLSVLGPSGPADGSRDGRDGVR